MENLVLLLSCPINDALGQNSPVQKLDCLAPYFLSLSKSNCRLHCCGYCIWLNFSLEDLGGTCNVGRSVIGLFI